MSDLVSQLVGALERLSGQCERMRLPGQPMSDAEKNAIAALTAAKAGGWVAVPVEPTPEMLKAGHESISCVGSCGEASPPEISDFCDVWTAMLAARPLPAPPKEQA